MFRGVVPADVFREQAVKLLQTLNLRDVQPVKPPLLQRPEVPLDFSLVMLIFT